jgi:hypothetical protein
VRAHSPREIEGGLKSCEGKLAHLGIDVPVRSLLSYANSHRPWQLFEKVFYGLFEAVAAKAQGTHKFRFKNKLVSLDSTVIDLCLSMYDWAKYRRTKGAVKLHLVLDHDGYLPCFSLVSDGNVADVKAAWRIAFTPGTIVVDDRGSNDYRLFAEWTDAGIYFVTRVKDNALFEIVEGMMSRTARLRPANCFSTRPIIGYAEQGAAWRQGSSPRALCVTNLSTL